MKDLFKLIFGVLASLFKSRAKLEAEILVLRQQIQHAAVAPSPAPERTVVSIGGAPLYTKAPGSNKFIDNTTVTLYGHVDVSGDLFNPGGCRDGSRGTLGRSRRCV